MRTPVIAALFVLLAALPGPAMEVSEVAVDYPLAPVLSLPATPAAPAAAAVTGSAAGTALPSTAVRGQWEEPWFAYRQNQLRGNARAAEDQLEKVRRFRVERGIPDLYLPAAALLFEASQAAGQGRYEDSLRLIESARKLAPGDPAPHFLRASVLWQENRLHFLSSFEAWLDGVAARFRDFRTLFPWLLNLAVWLTSALFVAAAVFIVSLAIRVFPLVAHDLSHLTGNLLWPWYIVPPLLLVLFIVTGVGFMWWFLLLPLMLVVHLGRAERAALAAACFLLVSLPLMVQVLALGDTYFRGSRERVLYEAERGGDGTWALASLNPYLADPADVEAQVDAALLYRREGRLDEAEKLLRAAARVAPASAAVMNNLGNIAFERGRVEEAIRLYQAALRGSDEGRIHFNLSQALRQNLQLDEGAREFLAAQSRDPAAVTEFSSVTEGNRRLTADLFGLGGGSLRRALNPDPAGLRFRDVLWRGILPGLSYGQALLVLPVLALLILAGWGLPGSLDPAVRCPKCGRLFCPRCTRINREGFCSQCHQIFVVRTGVDPANRVRKMMQIMNFHKASAFSARIGTIILPGLGHSAAGSPVLSLLFLAVSSGFWTAWVMWGGLLRSATSLEAGGGAGGRILFFLAFGLFYFIALRHIARQLEEA